MYIASWKEIKIKKKVACVNNFNLLVSTSRFNEHNAKAELWFTLLICGDQFPIISRLDFPGLIQAVTSLSKAKLLSEIKRILKRDPTFFQYILKIIPIDFTCETNVNVIKTIVQNHYSDFIHENETFMIKLKRRSNEAIDRTTFIEKMARDIDNEVDLTNPDKILRFEILDKVCGIAFLKPGDIISIGLH